MKCSLGMFNFLEEIFSLSSLPLHWMLRKAFLSLLAILWNSAFKWVYFFLFSFSFSFLFSHLFVRPPQTTILPFSISFSWGWSWSLLPVQYHKPLSTVLQALSLSNLILWIYLSLPLYNCKGFKSYLNGLVVFPTSFNFSLNLATGVHDLSHSQLLVLFLLTVQSFFIFGCKEYNQSDFGVDHLVMSMCRIFSCVVGKGCLLWPVCSLGKTLLAFALLHSVFQGQICLLLQVSPDFLLLHSSPL